MRTNEVAADGAAPAGRFGFKETVEAVIFYLIEVIDKAHGIFGTVAFIDLPETGTGIVLTSKAKAGIVIPFLAGFYFTY